MKKSLNTISFVLILFLPFVQYAQLSNSGFYGESGGVDVCKAAGSFMTDEQIIELIDKMVSKMGLENRFVIKSCSTIDNCQAAVYENKPFILYNKNFLQKVKSLKFSETSLKKVEKTDWEVLTVLAHELGHHFMFHMTNPHPDKTPRDLELEADKFAGRMMKLMGASLEQAQQVFNHSSVPEKATFTHPARKDRLRAIAKGWKEAEVSTGSSEYVIDEGEVFELAKPRILRRELLYGDGDDEDDFAEPVQIPIKKQNSISPEVEQSDIFRLAINKLNNIEYYYFIEQIGPDEFDYFRVEDVQSEMYLPNEEYWFSIGASGAQKIIVLMAARNLSSELMKKLVAETDNLQSSDTILEFIEESEMVDYYNGLVYPVVLNLGNP